MGQRAVGAAADFLAVGDGVAVAQALRELPAVQNFLLRYPGVSTAAVAVTSGFPAWLRLSHFLNLFFMTFIVRAGVQILADHRGCIGSATARRERSGFVSSARFRPIEYGPLRTIQSPCRDGWASPESVTPSGSLDGGIFPSPFFG